MRTLPEAAPVVKTMVVMEEPGPRVYAMTPEGPVELADVVAVRVRQEPGAPPEAFIEICPVDALAETERVAIKRHEDWPDAKLASAEELKVHFHGPEEETT